MASGDQLAVLDSMSARFPTSTPAVIVFPANDHECLEFDPATSWSAFFLLVLPKQYACGGITIKITWAASAAGAGNVGWRGYWSRDNAGADISSDSNYSSAQSSTFDAANGANIAVVSTIAFTNGAQISSAVVDDTVRFKVDRDAASGSDTFASRARILSIEVKET